MGEILISTTLLICMVLMLQRWTKGKVSMRLRYALWIVVALRLVVPGSFGSSSFSVLNLTTGMSDEIMDMAASFQTEQVLKELVSDVEEKGRESGELGEDTALEKTANAGAVDLSIVEDGRQTEPAGVSGEQIIGKKAGIQSIFGVELTRNAWLRVLPVCLWAAGMLIVGGCMLVNQTRFMRYLRHMRTEVEEQSIPKAWNRRLQVRRMHVYTVTKLPSPCLVGCDIYIEPQLLSDQNRLQHVLAHEYAHAVQWDPLWAVLRSALCAVYWFYPLIWVAAWAAKRDSELACDEHAILFLGESERFAYGRTLLDLLAGSEKKKRAAGAVLIMGSSRQNMKERVSMIAARRENRKVTAVVTTLTVFLVCGCAFTGAQESKGKRVLLTNQGSLSAGGTEKTEEGSLPQEEVEKRTQESGQPNPVFGQEQREAGAQDSAEKEVFGEEQPVFEELLASMDDSSLAEAEPVRLEEYWDYIYEGKECPLEDGMWYRLSQEKEPEISFYGLYTEEYGCRGMKIGIGGDVNTFDQLWIPTSFNMDVMILEESETDGMPRSFAFTVCVENNNNGEKWQLYVADRYDTGTIELTSFEERAYLSQREEENLSLHVDQERKKISVIQEEGENLGTIDFASYYGEEQIDKALWDDRTMGYRLEEEGKRITLVTGIGLQEADSDKVFFNGISLIGFPVEIGTFGNHSFTLGTPEVDDSVSIKRNL